MALIKNLMSQAGFLSVAENTGPVISTILVAISKSSKGSLWPIYFIITSIPPHHRSKMDNLIVASLWFGPTNPGMSCMLQPVLNKIPNINSKGFDVHSATSKTVYLRTTLLMGVFDLPARAAATNTKQYNGEYSCLYCLDKGVYQNRARIFPPNGACTLQTTEQMRNAPYSLRKHMSNINKLLSKFKPPNEVLRHPRSIDNMSFYKASEYRAWLLFYSLPILSNFLPIEYIHHFLLLVSSTHILLSDSIKTGDLELVDRKLLAFYQSAVDFYSTNVYTANIHSLAHIVSLVKLWSPLWAYSMFGFENIHGYLGTTFHVTKKSHPR
uniref:DUF4218 domain-containing protein n=1 Tax=Amphimedon queenslandica TaxID=400682 RepID=A0A1X7VJE6_AMPQE